MEILPLIEAKVTLTSVKLCEAIYQACVNENLKIVVKNSYEHVGIFPLDKSKMLVMIESEKPVLRDENIEKAVVLVKEKLKEIRDIQMMDVEERQEEKKRKRRKVALDTSFATVLTDPSKIAQLVQQKSESEIKKLRVNELQTYMLTEMAFSPSDLQANGKKLIRKELLFLVKQKNEQKVKEVEKEIENQVGELIKKCPEIHSNQNMANTNVSGEEGVEH